MKKGKLCPSCNEDIGVKAIFFASLPSRIRCPHCNARLMYGDTAGVLAYSIILYIVLLLAFINYFTQLTGFQLNIYIELIIVFLLWTPFEIFLTHYLRNNKILFKYTN